jgi:pimeloyl-ACP methyl ester carboxylesterase
MHLFMGEQQAQGIGRGYLFSGCRSLIVDPFAPSLPEFDRGGPVMWKAIGYTTVGWQSMPVLEVVGLPSSKLVLDEVRRSEMNMPSHLMEYLDREANEDAPSGLVFARDAAHAWGHLAAEESRGFAGMTQHRVAVVDSDAIALFANEDSTPTGDVQQPICTAWQAATSVVIPLSGGLTAVRVEYSPETAERDRLIRMMDHHGRGATVETLFEWRGYFGSGTAILDGLASMWQTGRSWVANLQASSGFLVGQALHRLRRRDLTLDTDPLAHRRLAAWRSRYPTTAARYPDLRDTAAGEREQCLVFVHGLVSCAIAGLRDLCVPPSLPGGASVFRFEHDTFLPIADNAEELARLVRERLQASQLLFIGHSRGGLVARQAAAILDKSGYRCAVEVWTFGTPHMGTPLVTAGATLLNLLIRFGEEVVNTLPAVSPLTRALSWLLPAPELPAGIASLRENSGELRILNQLTDVTAPRVWGSRYDMQKGSPAYGLFVDGLFSGILAGADHDLVVPVPSALGVGAAEPLLGCSHSGYFAEPSVRQAIAAYFGAPPTPEPGGAAQAPPRRTRSAIGGVVTAVA